MILHFSQNPVTAVTFTSLSDNNMWLLFVGDLYDDYGPSAGTSAFSGV
jgi:hypothetical protein